MNKSESSVGVPQQYAERMSELYERARNPVKPPYLERVPTPGCDRERVGFINSIGGLADSFPMPIAIQLYKKYFPQDTSILYDAMFLHHYYLMPTYIDEVLRARELVLASYAPQMIQAMDSSLPKDGGYAFADARLTKVVSTHHAHQRVLLPVENVIKMDWMTVLADHVLQGLAPLRLHLKPQYQMHIEGLLRILQSDGRPLIAIQNRGACPYNTMQIGGEQYKRELETLAEALVAKHNARVLLCGDIKLESPARYAAGDWVDLDDLVKNIYFKFELLRHCDYMFSPPSGFSLIVNMMRGPEKAPAIFLYCKESIFSHDQYLELYPKYIEDGGGNDGPLILMTYQHPDLAEFLFDLPHNPAKALDFFEHIMAQRQSAQAKPESRWLVPSANDVSVA